MNHQPAQLKTDETRIFTSSRSIFFMDYTERDHLKGKYPVVSVMYEKLVKQLKLYGQLKIEPKKSSIHLSNRSVFAIITGRVTNIHLEFYLPRGIYTKRITKLVQASADRFLHTIRLDGVTDIDEELLAWLKEAHNQAK